MRCRFGRKVFDDQYRISSSISLSNEREGFVGGEKRHETSSTFGLGVRGTSNSTTNNSAFVCTIVIAHFALCYNRTETYLSKTRVGAINNVRTYRTGNSFHQFCPE